MLGKIIRHNYSGHWLAARIIETEAYYLSEKASHASLGYTAKRKALFMPPGTIYMYYARGKDSLNISCRGKGNAVLIKSAHFYYDQHCDPAALTIMQSLNPTASGHARDINKLCSGQTLLCSALDIKVSDWDQKNFNAETLYIDDVGYKPASIINSSRPGIPQGRDEDLLLRYIDQQYARYCTRNPLTQKKAPVEILNLK